jgi:hypothetical protein
MTATKGAKKSSCLLGGGLKPSEKIKGGWKTSRLLFLIKKLKRHVQTHALVNIGAVKDGQRLAPENFPFTRHAAYLTSPRPP